jgi:iron complex outermembrane receptor protein
MTPLGSPYRTRRLLQQVLLALGLVVCVPSHLCATTTARLHFEIPTGDAAETLLLFAQQARREVMFPADPVAKIQTNSVSGIYTPREALELMLAATPLIVVEDAKSGAMMIGPAAHKSSPIRAVTNQESKSSKTQKMKRKNALALFGALVALVFTPSHAAEPSATGTIEGRVNNTVTGEYVKGARVTIVGTSIEAFSDPIGQYRLKQVPPGAAEIEVFFTGIGRYTETVQVGPGETVRRNINIGADSAAEKASRSDETIKLEKYVVSTSKELERSAIAINETRFASNIKSVYAVEEFGNITEGNVGEILKYIPGLTPDSAAGEAGAISMGGAPPNAVPVTLGGMSLATGAANGTTGASGGMGRQVQFEQFSVNNIARVEVNRSPTPEQPGNSLAGSINLVQRSAFEYSKPVFEYSVYASTRGSPRHSLEKTPGPFESPTRKAVPGFTFNYIKPVNDRFGFTVSGGTDKRLSFTDQVSHTWRGVGAASNGTLFPDPVVGHPYLTTFANNMGTSSVERYNIGVSADYKLTDYDRISFSYFHAHFNNTYRNRVRTFTIDQVLPGDYSDTFTHGAVGRGSIQTMAGANAKITDTDTPAIVYRHDGPVWKIESGLGYARAANKYLDFDDGILGTLFARRTGVTIAFDGINGIRPDTINVSDGTTGAAINPSLLGSYTLNTASSVARRALDEQRTAFVNVQRDFELSSEHHLRLKAGLDLREQKRDYRMINPVYTYVGPDGRATSTPADPLGSDDGAAPLLDESISQRYAPFDFGQIQWLNLVKGHELFTSHPEYFTTSENSNYRARVTNSKAADEGIYSGYVRGDLTLFRRLKIVGGVRAEVTQVEAVGPQNDPTGNYQRDSSGNIVRDSGGNPVLIVPTTNALGVSQRTYIERGQKAEKEYLRLFPSLNASYELGQNMVVRAAYSTAIGRPDFNQYAGGITLPDTNQPPGGSNVIVVNNAGIKPWTAETFSARIEYYFPKVGQFSVGAFHRTFTNFFTGTTVAPTEEFLALYGLDPDVYGQYNVSTQLNLPGKVVTTGYDFEYKQALTFLPHWARGIQVFANGTFLNVPIEASTPFASANNSTKTGSGGLSFTREKFVFRINYTTRNKSRQTPVTGRGIEAGTYNWIKGRAYLDIHADYYFRKELGLFLSVRNATNTNEDREISGPSTPSTAQFLFRQNYGAVWQIGIRGKF